MAETYEISVQCRNCKCKPEDVDTSTLIVTPKKFAVPKGKPVKDFLQEMTCENCGCEGYMGLL